MSDKLKIAFRRNVINRGWSSFKQLFAESCKSSLPENSLILAKELVELEEELSSVINRLRVSRQLHSLDEQSIQDVELVVNQFSLQFSSEYDNGILTMVSNLDYQLNVDPHFISDNIVELIKFDGEAIYYYDRLLDKGIGIDCYESENSDTRVYTIERWG